MKISVAPGHRLRFPSGGQPFRPLCRQYLAMDSVAMEDFESQNGQPWWNHLGYDSSIDTFHPDDTLFSSLNSDYSKLSRQSDSHLDGENRLQPLIDRGPAELSQQQLRLAEVNPTSFEVAPSHRHEHRHEQSIDLCYPAGNDVQSLSKLPEDDLLSSDGERQLHPTVFMSECQPSAEEAASSRVKLMCSFGGRIMPRPIDGKLRYVGGETRIVSVTRGISFTEFMSKMAQFYGSPLGLKYQLPDEDLDALVSVSSDDDLQNMMEEYDKVESGGSLFSRLRLFFFSSLAEVEVSELKMEVEDGRTSSDKRFVDAINGVPEKLYGCLLEEDADGSGQVNGLNNAENSGRMGLHDLANVMTHTKCPPAPSLFSSSPSLTPMQAAYQKPPSLQSINEGLSKVTVNSRGVEGDFNQDGSGNSFSTSHHDYQYHHDRQHHDQQYHVAADSPRITNNGLSVSRGVPVEHGHDMQQSCDILVPQGEHQRFLQQHKHIPQQKLQQPSGRVEHCLQDMHKQSQAFHQPHHQPPHHRLNHIVAAHDGSSWNTEHHAMPPYVQGSTQNHPQILHGMTSAPPYQMGSAHPPPRVADYQGKCSCGLQHSQVHRGITVSIGDQSYNRWPPHFGDQPTRKHGFWNSSRFCDNTSYCTDSPLWQQPSHLMGTAEAEHREQIPRQHFHGRYHRDCRGTECQARGHASQYCDPPAHNEAFLPSHGRHETNKRCLCNWHDKRSQPAEKAMIHSAYPDVQDQLPEWAMHQKGFEVDGGRVSASKIAFPRISLHKDEDFRGEFADEKCIEGESGLYLSHVAGDFESRRAIADEKYIEGESGLYLSHVPGDFESRRAMATPIDGMLYVRKPPTHAGSVIKPLVSEELLVSQPLSTLSQGQSELHPVLTSLKTSAEVSDSQSMASLEPGSWADFLSSQHGEASNRFMEAASDIPLGREMSRNNCVSSTLLMMEGTNSSNETGMFVGKHVPDHGEHTSESYQREDYDKPSAARRAAGEAIESLPASSSGFINTGSDGVRVSAAHGDTHWLSPDVTPLGAVAATLAASHVGQAVPAVTVITTALDDPLNTPASPIYDWSPLSSTNITGFSFAPRKTKPPVEINIDKEPFASHMSVTELLADNMVLSVLKSCSNEGLLEENKDIDQKVVDRYSHQAPNCQMTEDGMEKYTRMGLLGLSSPLPCVIEQGKDQSVTETSTVNEGLKVVVAEEKSEVVQMVQSGVINKTSYNEKDSEVENSCMEETKDPALSQAEAEAIARCLQIIKNSDLEDLKELGSGTFGTVYHGKWRGSDVAIKRIKASCFTGQPSERERLISDFWKEAWTLGQLHHPNVVAFYGVVPDGPGGTLATVTEYMVNGSLKQVLHKKDRTIDRRKRLFIAMDAAFGMEYLHSKNIVHFDLKCENLLVNMRDAHRPICKVGDFGLSKVKHQTLVSGGVRGTLPWMAPELLRGNCSMVTEKIDVFSFGVVMWELLTGEEPYANMHCGAIIGGIVNNTLRLSIPSWCDPGWRNLMERCWSGDPAERPAFAEVARELRAIAASLNMK